MAEIQIHTFLREMAVLWKTEMYLSKAIPAIESRATSLAIIDIIADAVHPAGPDHHPPRIKLPIMKKSIEKTKRKLPAIILGDTCQKRNRKKSVGASLGIHSVNQCAQGEACPNNPRCTHNHIHDCCWIIRGFEWN